MHTDGQTDGQIDHYRAPTFCRALKYTEPQKKRYKEVYCIIL